MPSKTDTFTVNPYIAGSPVKDKDMFFGRDDVYAWLRHHLQGKYQDSVIVLFGERRSGKTSVLYQMRENLGIERYVPVLIDLQGMAMEGMDGFLWEVARKIVLGLRSDPDISKLERPNRRDFEQHPQHHFEENFLPPIIEALGNRHLLIMVDETGRLEDKVNAGDLSPDVYGYLRAFIQKVDRVNFIFSLGSLITDSQRGPSQLFSLAVYRKISFLDRDYAEDLITRPVSKYYAYTPAAIERILALTAGQAYYTQLMCHNLFTLWNNSGRPEIMTEAQVGVVIPDVIEHGTPNLKFAWEDSSLVEKVVLSALTDRLPNYRAGVMRRNLDRALRDATLYPPYTDVSLGLKKLFERDIINNSEPYNFNAKLVQMWLEKYKRLEWIHDELADEIQSWQQMEEQRRLQAPSAAEQAQRWAPPALVGLMVGIVFAVVVLVPYFNRPPPQNTQLDSQRATEVVAALQATINAGQMLAAEANEDDQERDDILAEEIQATQTAVAREVSTAEAQVSELIEQQEATAAAAAAEAQNLSTRAAIAEATSQAAQQELEEYYQAAATATATSTPTPTPTPLPTETPRPTFTPTPTPVPLIAGRLAVPVFDGQAYNINIYQLPTGEILHTIFNARQPTFHAGTDQLVVTNTQNDTIWLYDADGNNGRQIGVMTGDRHPTLSPDGTQLAYNRRPEFSNNWYIFVQNTIENPNISNMDRLAGDILDAFSPLYPLWNDNGQLLFYACNYWQLGQSGQCGVWLTQPYATLRGSGFIMPQNITSQQEIPTDTQASRVLVMGNVTGNWDVYRISLTSGHDLTNLTNNSANDGLGAFSPDGRWVAFVSSRDGAWAVWVIPSAGGQATRMPIENLRFGGGDFNWTTERISWGP